jgi:hypothetical protein
VLSVVPAHAQLATRTFVSGVGDDGNPLCTRTAPCKTFAGAIAKTARDGEITVLDPAGYGTVTITKSITINGTPGQGYGSMIATAGITGAIINIVDPADTRRTVRLNWLDINGAGSGGTGIRIAGGNLVGTSVVVENSVIDGFTGRGISDERTNGGKLVVSDTTIRHNVGSCIHIGPGGTRIDAALTNVKAHNCAGAGVSVDGNGKVVISNSALTGNTTGIDIAQANIEVLADNVTLSGNTTGMDVAANATLRLSNSNVAFNGTGLTGTVQTHSTNRFIGNGAGGTLQPFGGHTSATGHQ